MKKRLWTAAIGMAVLVSACGGGGGGEAGGTPDPDGSIVFMDSAPNPDLDPAGTLSDSSFSQAVLYAVYDRLLTFEADGSLKEGLAEEWGFTDDSLEIFELTLREGVTFHDGEALTADVVKENLERSQELGDAAGATVKAAAASIASVEAVDERTVRITLNEPSGGFPFALATQLGMMLSPASLDGSSGVELDPVGTGPYEVESFQPNDTTTLTRFEDFWAGTDDRPATFEVKYVTDDQTRLNALRSGQANVVLLTPRQVKDAESSGIETKVNNTSSMWVIYENTSGPLEDVKVRQALMQAIDRETISTALQFGTGEPSFQLVAPGTAGELDDAGAEYPFDPDAARALLSDAGYEDGLELDYVLLNTPEYVQLTETLQQQLADVGVTLNITTLDISQAGEFMSGETGDMMLARWGGRADQLQTLEVVVGPDGTYAPAGAVTPTLGDLIDEANTFAADDPDRAAAVQAANQEAVDQAASIPVVTRANIYGFKPGCISGLEEYLASGSNDWRDVTVSNGCSGS